MRHTLWQAAIASKYGESIAIEVGNAHENNPNVDLSKTSFTNIVDADQTVDLLNNQIGRQIGLSNRGKNMKDLAITVLDEFKNRGLYTAQKDKNGNWIVSKTCLTKEKYTKLINIYRILNDNAFKSQEQKQYDLELKQKLEQIQITWGTMK